MHLRDGALLSGGNDGLQRWPVLVRGSRGTARQKLRRGLEASGGAQEAGEEVLVGERSVGGFVVQDVRVEETDGAEVPREVLP